MPTEFDPRLPHGGRGKLTPVSHLITSKVNRQLFLESILVCSIVYWKGSTEELRLHVEIKWLDYDFMPPLRN